MKRRRLTAACVSKQLVAGQSSSPARKTALQGSTGKRRYASTWHSAGDHSSAAGCTLHPILGTPALSSNHLYGLHLSSSSKHDASNDMSTWNDRSADVSLRVCSNAAQQESRACSKQTLMLAQRGQIALHGGISRPSHIQESHTGREDGQQLRIAGAAGKPLPWHGKKLKQVHFNGCCHPDCPSCRHACQYCSAECMEPLPFFKGPLAGLSCMQAQDVRHVNADQTQRRLPAPQRLGSLSALPMEALLDDVAQRDRMLSFMRGMSFPSILHLHNHKT